MSPVLPDGPQASRPPAWLPDLAALAALILGFLVAPDFATDAARAGASDFFATSAQIVATLLVAIALFQGLSSAGASYRVRRFLTWRTFAYIALSELAAIAGLTNALPDGAYVFAFAATLGGGAGALAAVLVAGLENIGAQREDSVETWLERIERRIDERLGGPKVD